MPSTLKGLVLCADENGKWGYSFERDGRLHWISLRTRKKHIAKKTFTMIEREFYRIKDLQDKRLN